MDCVLRVAEEERCRKVWLITTNDNMNALRFYQNVIFDDEFICKCGGRGKKIKKEIPRIGYDNIPILHEIQLEYSLV